MNKDIMQEIRNELTRTEEIIRNKHRIYGFSNDNFKIELSTKVFVSIVKDKEQLKYLKGKLFGIDFEVKEDLKRDFIIYIDSYNLDRR